MHVDHALIFQSGIAQSASGFSELVFHSNPY
jgi:hypothetical protein